MSFVWWRTENTLRSYRYTGHMKFTGFALAILGVVMGVGVLASWFYWKSGSDLNEARTARNWIEMCARETDDIYCKLAYRLSEKAEGPLLLIHPNRGSRPVARDIQDIISKSGINEAENAIRANIFYIDTLKTGQIKNLNGSIRSISCSKDLKKCDIEGREITTEKFYNDGSSVYLSYAEQGYDFLIK